MMRSNVISATFFLLCAIHVASAQLDVPSVVIDPRVSGARLNPENRNYVLSLDQLKPAHVFSAGEQGQTLQLDLGDSTLSGRIFFGQAWFEAESAEYLQTIFRERTDVIQGKALLNLHPFLRPGSITNANRWTTGGAVGYRLELTRIVNGRAVTAGIFDSKVFFTTTATGVRPIVSVLAGPAVGLVQSEHPDWMVVSFETDRPANGLVEVEGVGMFENSVAAVFHEIRVSGLRPAHSYRYRVVAVDDSDSARTPWFRFRSAPARGADGVVFCYGGDARASSGGSEYEYIGTNRMVLNQIMTHAKRQRADFFLFGGDLIGGYTNSEHDFRLQMRGFKEGVSGLVSSIPLYAGIGNHESLHLAFTDTAGKWIIMDRWPYESGSTEVVFAQELVQPTNGPSPRPGFPPYTEGVFSFQYGTIKAIVLNNDYWWTTTNRIPKFGGSPEGFFLPEQLEWLAAELRTADADPTVRHIVVFAHEPVFPGGGHLTDAMWYNGNNNIRAAWRTEQGTIEQAGEGIVEVRNKLWTMLSKTKKVSVVLGSDEHNYQRMLITRSTPVGTMTDDKNGDGILNDGVLSPVSSFGPPLWFIVSGGAGAPYYTQQVTPWHEAVKAFSPRHHYILFRAHGHALGMEVYTNNGELIDEVKDLRKVRR